jgi:chemotaxis protein MotB
LHGIRKDQVTQVGGFADQKLRKLDDPLDPANRRISLIVQYLDKQRVDLPKLSGEATEVKPGAGAAKPEDAAKPADATKPAQKPAEKK